MSAPAVVVGASLAGLRAAEALRARGWEGELVMVGAEPHMPYTRPPLSKALLGGALEPAGVELECEGVDAEWRHTVNSRRAKFYSLTRAGRKQLDAQTADWNRRASAIARLLKAEG